MFEPVTITSTAVTTGWPVVCGMGVTSCADAALTEGRTPAMIARRKPVLARFFMAAHSCSAAREFSAKSCNNRMAAIIAEYLIIFKPLMESFSTGRRARLCRGSAQSRDASPDISYPLGGKPSSLFGMNEFRCVHKTIRDYSLD